MRILFYSKTRLFAECLAGSLSLHPDVKRADWVCDLDAATDMIRRDPSMAIVVDFSCPDAWADVRSLVALDTRPIVLALAVEDTPADLVRCAQVGCAGVIPHESSVDRTVALLRQARRGELRCSPAAAASLMKAVSRMAPNRTGTVPNCLTRREGEICGLVCEGLSNKEIARALTCSEGTVKNHVHSILAKLGVHRRSALPRQILHYSARHLPSGAHGALGAQGSDTHAAPG